MGPGSRPGRRTGSVLRFSRQTAGLSLRAAFSVLAPCNLVAPNRKTHLRIPAARFARALQIVSPLKEEGAGNAGCLLHPRSRVQKNNSKRTRAYRYSRSIPASLRNGFTAYAALSPATNSSCHRHRRIEGFANPVGLEKTSADLTPATGARTTRFCRTQPPVFAKRLRRALASFVWRAMVAHGRPALRSRSRPTLPRPPHLIPTFVTTADAPRAE